MLHVVCPKGVALRCFKGINHTAYVESHWSMIRACKIVIIIELKEQMISAS